MRGPDNPKYKYSPDGNAESQKGVSREGECPLCGKEWKGALAKHLPDCEEA